MVTVRELGFVTRIVTSPDPPGNSALPSAPGPAGPTEMLAVCVRSEAPPTLISTETPTCETATATPTQRALATPKVTRYLSFRFIASSSYALGELRHTIPAHEDVRIVVEL